MDCYLGVIFSLYMYVLVVFLVQQQVKGIEANIGRYRVRMMHHGGQFPHIIGKAFHKGD